MDSFGFSTTCRTLAAAARAYGLEPPSFRSPPRVSGATRTLRRRAGSAPAVVSVTYHGRPPAAVLADLVEGVVVANHLAGPEALRARSALWEALAAHRSGAAA